MATSAVINITPGLGQMLDAVTLVVGVNTVVRETMVIADPTSATHLAQVSAGGALLVDASATTQPVVFPVPQHVIVDSGGGGGTQYTTGAIVASPIGTAALGWDGTNVRVLSTDATGQLKVLIENSPSISFVAPQHVIVDSGGGGGTQYTDGTAESVGAFTITVAGLYNGTGVVGLRGDASNNLYVNLHTALPAGSNVIGHVITDSSSTTAVTQSTAANLNATVVGTGTFAVQASITTLGQQLAAASVPVVLTAAQITTLTPLATVAVTQTTSPWIVAGGGTAGTAATGVITVQGIASMTPLLVTATFSAAQHVIVDSGTIAVTQSTSPWVVSNGGTFAVQAAIADGADVTLGAKADAKSTATDTTAISIMSVLKEISFMEQNPASRAVTNAGTFAVQAACTQTTSPWVISGTVTEATLDAALISQEATTSGIKGLTIFGAVTTAAPTYTTGKSDALSLDTAGNLRVVLNAETSKVIGTVNQGTSPWVVSLSSTTITGSVAVTIADGADVTLGAKADAKSTATDTTAISIMSVLKEISFMEQNPASRAVTNSGTFAVQAACTQTTSPWVISGAVTEATLDAALIAQEATTSGVKGLTIFGAVTTAAPSYTTAKSDALSLDTSGNLRVVLNAETSKVIGTVNQGTSPWIVAGGGTAGSAATGVVTIQGIASMTKLLVTPDAGSTVTPVPATSGGCSIGHLVSAGSTNATSVKASAGQVYGWTVYNNAAYPIYLKFYNTAGTPTAGTGVVKTVGVQAGMQLTYSQPLGIAFSTGIGITITKGIADNDATAVLANDCVIDVEYK